MSYIYSTTSLNASTRALILILEASHIQGLYAHVQAHQTFITGPSCPIQPTTRPSLCLCQFIFLKKPLDRKSDAYRHDTQLPSERSI